MKNKEVISLLLVAVLAFMTIAYIVTNNKKKDLEVQIFQKDSTITVERVFTDSLRTLHTKYRGLILRWEILERSDIWIPEYFEDDRIDSCLKYGTKYNIPDSIHFRLLWYESRFKDTISSEGAEGIYQLMPLSTRWAEKDGCTNQYSCGCYTLWKLYQINPDWRLVISYYNSGYWNSNDSGVVNFVNNICNGKL